MEPATLALLSAGGGLIGFLLSGFEALKRQSDLQTGGNSHDNSTRQAWRPFPITSRYITSRS